MRRARTKAEKEQSKTQHVEHVAIYDDVAFDKSRDKDVNYIPLSANEAYATAVSTQDNVAYGDLNSTHIYEEYSYI